MNEKVEIPKETLERLMADALTEKAYWDNKSEAMSNWHEGRASMAKMLLDVFGR